MKTTATHTSGTLNIRVKLIEEFHLLDEIEFVGEHGSPHAAVRVPTARRVFPRAVGGVWVYGEEGVSLGLRRE